MEYVTVDFTAEEQEKVERYARKHGMTAEEFILKAMRERIQKEMVDNAHG